MIKLHSTYAKKQFMISNMKIIPDFKFLTLEKRKNFQYIKKIIINQSSHILKGTFNF